MLPLGFRFAVDAVIIGGIAHRTDCTELPGELPAGAAPVLARGVLLAQRCPRECPRCRPPFETLLTHQLDLSVGALVR